MLQLTRDKPVKHGAAVSDPLRHGA